MLARMEWNLKIFTESSEKCKLKPQWDTISHLSEWLLSINQQTTNAVEYVEKGNPSALLVGMQTGAATVENSTEFPQKMKNGSVYTQCFHFSGD